jgi:hypothetical protein
MLAPAECALTEPGGLPEISRWRKPPDPCHTPPQPRQGLREMFLSNAPRGLTLGFMNNRWLAPPANFHQPFRLQRSGWRGSVLFPTRKQASGT